MGLFAQSRHLDRRLIHVGRGRLVIARALAAAALVAGAVSSARPAVATDLDTLRARAQAVADDVSSLEHRLAGLRTRQRSLDERIDQANADIGMLELEIHNTDAAYRAALDRYVDRAIETYKAGTSTRLAILLSARTLGDLEALTDAVAASGVADRSALEELVAAKQDAESAQDRIDARKQQLMAARAEAETVALDMRSTIAERRSVLAELTDQVERLERKARRLAAQALEPDTALLDLLAGAGPAPDIPTGYVGTGVAFEGIASWYGPGFEGNLTASGDVFDSSLFTAASKELPLGTWLYVTHAGKGVVVLVNDRGPYIDGRVLDLSHAAAQAIGITGLGWIRAEIIIES